jgi:hypothetical protein
MMNLSQSGQPAEYEAELFLCVIYLTVFMSV